MSLLVDKQQAVKLAWGGFCSCNSHCGNAIQDQESLWDLQRAGGDPKNCQAGTGRGNTPMDNWKGISGLGAISKTLHNTPRDDLLTCKTSRASNAYSSTLVSRQLWPKLRSQEEACVLVCWHDTAISSIPYHYHSLPTLLHLYGVILSLSLLDFLMSSIQGI